MRFDVRGDRVLLHQRIRCQRRPGHQLADRNASGIPAQVGIGE